MGEVIGEVLLRYTPAGARRVGYIGSRAEAFGAALVRRNPRAVTVAADEATEGVLVVEDLAGWLAQGAPDLSTVETLVAGLSFTDVGRLRALCEAGFEVAHLRPLEGASAVFDDAATNLAGLWSQGGLTVGEGPLVVIARRGGKSAMMHLRHLSSSPNLMDIRTRLPAEAMRSEPSLLVSHHRPPVPAPRLEPGEAGVMVYQRPAPLAPDNWRKAVMSLVDQGWLVVLEYDDHPGLVARINGREPGPADWVRFAGVHAVQTSTPPLVQLFRKYNPEVRQFPNAVFDLPTLVPPEGRRVFYGAVRRGPYAVEVARSLGAAIDAFPDLEFEVVGDNEVFDALPTDRKRFHDYLPYEPYLDLMGTCAVSLSPLAPGEYLGAKSDAKFLDAAGRGVLSLVSPTVYKGVVRHRRNGLIAEGVGDWAPRLIEALGDDAGRRRMVEAAWIYVSSERMFADQVRQRHDWYRDLWRRRDKLTAGLKARLKA